MGSVGAFTLPGYDLYFPSNDHLPPHFHVEKPGHWTIKVMINWSTQRAGLKYKMVQPKNGRRKPTAGEEAEILEAVLSNRRKLLREFYAKVNLKGGKHGR